MQASHESNVGMAMKANYGKDINQISHTSYEGHDGHTGHTTGHASHAILTSISVNP